MKSITCLVLCAGLTCAASAPAVAQDASKGAALLAEAKRAVGGEEKLRAIRALDVRGDVDRDGAPPDRCGRSPGRRPSYQPQIRIVA
jgi:hypothetical protein